ncbi:dTDP-4-keto-L-rhamnose reductase [Candidatus Photodesmus blepharus]|uniref:dTDP-4-dehydrorhamnose reductase n=1 Tax=Candidatus Photodesmus blepharonis TaxID=1179155 RepID=A0A084CMH0_9GAMM|nr:dTDP-4-dehydrorhamnose reductase [Candidatus Photodesmus blepharus]KEY90999.1 dTDP-4-keto-L-rhamnose reductase [Candidatus Photodesmus blepharus]
MKILITGSNGQLGCSLISKLNNKVDVLAITRSDLNIVDKQAVFACIKKIRPDYILNAAAYTAVDKADLELELAFKVNCDGVAYLAEAAQIFDSVLFHISTDYVFDGLSNNAYTEMDVARPQSVYGKSKLAGEKMVLALCKKHIILRTSWVFGEHGNNFLKTMLRLARVDDVLSVVDDQFGGPTYSGDLADALITMLKAVKLDKNPEWGIYHFSGLPYVSWYGFAKKIFFEAERSGMLIKYPNLAPISSGNYPMLVKRPRNSKLNSNKINRIFGIKASSWETALKKIFISSFL